MPWCVDCLHGRCAPPAQSRKERRASVHPKDLSSLCFQNSADKCPDTSWEDSPRTGSNHRRAFETTPDVLSPRDGPANTERQCQEQSPAHAHLLSLQVAGNLPMSRVPEGLRYARLFPSRLPRDSRYHRAQHGLYYFFLCGSCVQSDESAACTKHQTPASKHNQAGPQHQQRCRAFRAQASTNAETTHTSLKTAPFRGLRRCLILFHTLFPAMCPDTAPSRRPAPDRGPLYGPLRCRSWFSVSVPTLLTARRPCRAHGLLPALPWWRRFAVPVLRLALPQDV